MLGYMSGRHIESSVDLDIIAKFYKSLKIKHDSSKLYYRGIGVSKKGFLELMKTGKLLLKKRMSESWSCDRLVAKRFLPYYSKVHKKNGSAGIILKRTIPKSAIIFNLHEISRKYKKIQNRVSYMDIVRGHHQDLPFGASGYDMLDEIENMGECELVTNTVCAACNLGEMSYMTFQYDQSDIIMRDFLLSEIALNEKSRKKLENHKIEDSSVVVLQLQNSGTWIINK